MCFKATAPEGQRKSPLVARYNGRRRGEKAARPRLSWDVALRGARIQPRPANESTALASTIPLALAIQSRQWPQRNLP